MDNNIVFENKQHNIDVGLILFIWCNNKVRCSEAKGCSRENVNALTIGNNFSTCALITQITTILYIIFSWR